MQLSTKPKSFRRNFIAFLEVPINYTNFEKIMNLITQLFLNYRLQKMWLLNCIKCPVSENPLAVNVIRHPIYVKNNF